MFIKRQLELLILTLVDIMVTLLCSSTEARNVTLCPLGSQRGGISPQPLSDGDEQNKQKIPAQSKAICELDWTLTGKLESLSSSGVKEQR